MKTINKEKFSERDIDGVMMDIIERAYKPQNKADKIKSLYMHHYDDTVRVLNKNSGIGYSNRSSYEAYFMAHMI